MSERVTVRQNSRFETEILASDPYEPESEAMAPVHATHELTPYGMLLASLGGCTAIVLHTYAQNHGVALQEVEIRLQYERHFQKDCEECEEIDEYSERIREEIVLRGELSERERRRLTAVAHHCPIYKMLRAGVEIESEVVEVANRE